jgi:hypothetical protein
MANQVYSRQGFVIFRVYNGFIVHNTGKTYKGGHTHLSKYNACKKAIEYVLYRRIPDKASCYYLTSLLRLSDDIKYSQKLKKLIDSRSKK